MFRLTQELFEKIQEKINGMSLKPALVEVSYSCSGGCYGMCRDNCYDTCRENCVHDCYGTCDSYNSGTSNGDPGGW